MIKMLDPIAEAERRGWNAAIEAAAERCDYFSDEWWDNWERHADPIDQGRSIGAEQLERVIRQLSKPEPEA